VVATNLSFNVVIRWLASCAAPDMVGDHLL
jgi:hypothetical protein